MASKSQIPRSALELIDYPSRFPLKVFGTEAAQLETVVLELVQLRCPQNEKIDIVSRQSRSGKYTALTLTFTVFSRTQIEAIYQDLYDCEQVVMCL